MSVCPAVDVDYIDCRFASKGAHSYVDAACEGSRGIGLSADFRFRDGPWFPNDVAYTCRRSCGFGTTV